MLYDALTYEAADVHSFDPRAAALRRIGIVIVPLFGLFALTIAAAIGGPAMLGSFGFRSKAFGFKASTLNPLSGLQRIFGMQGIVELGKSLVKVVLLGAVGVWPLMAQGRSVMGSHSQAQGPDPPR